MTIKTLYCDDYTAVLEYDLDLGDSCPICGNGGLARDQGVVDMCGTTLVRSYVCNACAEGREIFVLHSDLMRMIGGARS